MKIAYEDVFFYLDLTKDIIKKKELIRAIKNYITEKNKINLKGHYGLLVFQEEGNPIFITDKKDSDIISNAIEENWKLRPKKQSFFENGLFYIFSYIAETVRKKSKFNRIIIITDTPSDLSEDYTDALFNLVSKIKNFPTFIDILRIFESGQRFFKDDVKLNILASDTKGGIYYIHDKKDFLDVMKDLVKSKQVVSIFEDQPIKIKISKEDYKFYNHLAKKLKIASKDQTGLKCYVCKDEICPVCANINDIPLKCEVCGTAFHNCCVINYTIQHNIGIPHIFRCPQCDILLKIKQDEIVQPDNKNIVSAEEYIEMEDQLSQDSNRSIDKFVEKSHDLENEIGTQMKTIRIGGYFGKVFTVTKEGDKLIYQKSSNERKANLFKSSLKVQNNTEPQIWKPSKNAKDKPSFIICPECGTQISSNDKKVLICPYCGHKLLNFF